MNAPSVIIQFTQLELEALLNSVAHEQARASTCESYYKDLEQLKEKIEGYYLDEHIVQFCIGVTVNAKPGASVKTILGLAHGELHKMGFPVDAIKELYAYVDGEEV